MILLLGSSTTGLPFREYGKNQNNDERRSKVDEKPASSVSSNCIDCPHHLVAPDPDPKDWFNDDDVAVLCTITPRLETSRFKNRAITSSCRPYNIRKESNTPNWCPLTTKASSDGKVDQSKATVR